MFEFWHGASPREKAKESFEGLQEAIVELIEEDWLSAPEIREKLDFGAMVGDKFAGTLVRNVLQPLIVNGRVVKGDSYVERRIGKNPYTQRVVLYKKAA